MKNILKNQCPEPEQYNILRASVNWGKFPISLTSKALVNTLYAVTIFHEEKTIGMGRITGDGLMYFYIQDVIVLPGFHGKGIGSMIMDNIMQYIHENSVNNSVVALMSAVGKEGFYEKYGFVKRPNEYLGCGMSMCIQK